MAARDKRPSEVTGIVEADETLFLKSQTHSVNDSIYKIMTEYF